MRKIYLAIPYSFDPERSFEIANRIASEMISFGYLVFSPITHSHPLSKYLPEETNNWGFWKKQDIPMIDWCDEVRFVVIGDKGRELLNKSEGCVEEHKYAKKKKKFISYYEYKE